MSPYLEVLGATSPTAPKPPKNKDQKCGGIGQVLLAVIAIAVFAVTRIPLTNFFATGSLAGGAAGATSAGIGATIAGGAAAGAVSSIASQSVGVATGIQDRFSWNAVALAAIGVGIGGRAPPPACQRQRAPLYGPLPRETAVPAGPSSIG